MRDYLGELLVELVETPSVNPLFAGPRSGPGGEQAIIDLLASRFAELGLESWVVDSSEAGRPSVVGCLRGSGGGRSLMLNGHVDTVGVESYDDPFVARLEEDRLYGRGSYDMKGGVAACLAAMRALSQDGPRLRGDLWISAVADEEAASLGAGAVAGRFPTDGVVITEPTELRPIVAHKGFVWVEVETVGFACHGSLHQRGVDANRRMAHVFRAIDRLEAERAALSHPLLGAPSLHVGRIEGGLGPSLYSPKCRLSLELRTLPGESAAVLLDRLRALVEEEMPAAARGTTAVEIGLHRPSLETAPSGPLASALAAARDAAASAESEPTGVAYWTDGGIFAAAGCEVVLFGPSGEGAHEDIEWVSLSSVRQTAETLQRLAIGYCGRAAERADSR